MVVVTGSSPVVITIFIYTLKSDDQIDNLLSNLLLLMLLKMKQPSLPGRQLYFSTVCFRQDWPERLSKRS